MAAATHLNYTNKTLVFFCLDVSKDMSVMSNVSNMSSEVLLGGSFSLKLM